MDLEFTLARLDATLDAARAIPTDALLLVSATAVILLAMSTIARVEANLARGKAMRRMSALQAGSERLAAELVTSRRALDAERQWRMAAEKAVAEAAKAASRIELLPARELHKLLERENLDPIQPAPKSAIERRDIRAAIERSEANLHPPAPPETPADATPEVAPRKSRRGGSRAKRASSPATPAEPSPESPPSSARAG